MSIEIKGTIYRIGEEVQVTEKFKKQEFILKVHDGNYDQYVKMQCVNDRTDLLHYVKVGQDITAHANLSGKMFTRKDGTEDCITNLNCWKIDAKSESGPAPSSPIEPEVPNDLPF